MKQVSLLLVGVGGYGSVIAKEVFTHIDEWHATVAGIVEPFYDTTPTKAMADARGVPHFNTIEEFYTEHTADLAIICSPIHFHEKQVIYALEHGSDCLCEKPTAATTAQSDRMAAAAARTGRKLHIGFQLCYVPSVLALKQDILDGVLGKPLSMSAMVCWPRGRGYYARPWCGKIKKDGHYVLDSIAMNACAHYLNVMLFLLGKTPGEAAHADSVDAIVSRINDVETFDTAMFKLNVGDVTCRYFVTHACDRNLNPLMRFEFENAVVDMAETDDENAVRATFRDGTVKNYGPIQRDFYRKIPYCIGATRGEGEPLCTTETAKAHLSCVEAVTKKAPVLTDLAWVEVGDVRVVEGLSELFERAFDKGVMPWELEDRFGKPVHIDLHEQTIWEGDE